MRRRESRINRHNVFVRVFENECDILAIGVKGNPMFGRRLIKIQIIAWLRT